MRYYHADHHGEAGPHSRRELARWARRGKVPKSDVIRALIDRAGPIETGDDLIAWAQAATGKRLGLAQKDS